MDDKQKSSSKNAKQRYADKLKEGERKKEREKIVAFFLDLYNVQLKGESDAPRSFREVGSRPGAESTYELRVKQHDKWLSRLMGISPIGEEGGSKSRCFKVIYDEILVVKVPLRPITDFEEYIQGIQKERDIAGLLEPAIKCIAPAVSPILKKVPSFFDDQCWVPEEVEEKSLVRLKHFPQFRYHLKVGDGFAYFMDISRYSFLLQVLESIMESDQKVKQEIVKEPEIISRFHKFEERYGVENASVWLNMHEIYQEYLEMIEALMSQYGLRGMSHDYKRRQWFLHYIAELEIASDDPRMSEEFVSRLKGVLEKLSKRYAADFKNYRRTVEEHVRMETFGQNRCQISGIVTSILRMLAELREKKAAIRDLKPENIFVAGESSNIALALAQREDVFLGLIDFETAVSIDAKKSKRLDQPLLGGTPSYATPSNFVPNEIIDELYGDIARVLHLQDWQACLCMIYSSVVGETLFVRTRGSLYQIINAMKKGVDEGDSFANVFKKNNYAFWKAAKVEFAKRIAANKRRLDEIDVEIPYDVKDMFFDEAERSMRYFQFLVKSRLKRQRYFKNPKTVESLLQSPPKRVAGFREKWQKGVITPQPSVETRKAVVNFLLEIEEFKNRQAVQAQWMETFRQRSLRVGAYDLLVFMFGVVTQTLHKTKPGQGASGNARASNTLKTGR